MKYIHYKSIIALSIILILSSCNMKDKKDITNIKKDSVKIESPELVEANEYFTYKGKPINPCFINEITENELGTEENVISSIDISYASTLKKYQNFGNPNNPSEGEEFRIIECKRDSVCKITWRKVTDRYEDGTYSYELGYFSYKWRGKLNNGVHVLSTITNGGGTANAVELLFVKFEEKEYYKDGIKAKRLFLTKVSEKSLGEPNDLNIKLEKEQNKVTVHYKDSGNYDKEENQTIQF
jgi:hypothetical protein